MSTTYVSKDNDHSDKCKEELSAKYAEYVDSHLGKLRAECEKINICVDELLEDGNIIVIINGYNLSIKKICSLMYNKNGSEIGGNSSDQCTPKDRRDIHRDFEDHLTYVIDNEEPGWKNVTKCLDNNYGESETPTYVDKICGLANNKTQICNVGTHKTIREFFNGQIQRLKCTCKVLPSSNETSEIPMPILIGSVAGGLLLLLLLFALGFICYRHKKKSRKRQKQASTVVYVQTPSSDPVYQEILDDKGHHDHKQSPALNPPTLPSRYTPVNTSDGTHFKVHEDSVGYLEPVSASSRLRHVSYQSPTLPLPGHPNPGYGVPPGYIQGDDMSKANTDNGHLEPADDEDKGYDTLGRNKTGVEASRAGMTPLGPVPAKRTKKDDRLTESQYFQLETDGNSTTDNSPV